MKTIRFLLTAIFFLSITYNSDAQIKDWLKQKKEEAKQKASAKIDQKASEGIDKTVNTPETVIKKKAEKKKNKKAAAEGHQDAATTGGTINETDAGAGTKPVIVKNEIPDENNQTVIQTNIRCKEGKAKLASALKKLKAITAADINTINGEVTVQYNTDALSYTQIISAINGLGFEADGNAPTNTKSNPCK